jgi:uncharacterized protein (TIGR02145 family)
MSYTSIATFLALFLISFTSFAQKKGDFVDKRDGQAYTTIKIGKQWWMVENLNYKMTAKANLQNLAIQTEISYDAEKGYPPSDRMKEVYGQFYTWEEACNVCPDGWKLPSKEDWEILFEEVGGKEIAGAVLASRSDLWDEPFDKSIKPIGFNIEPAGYRFYILFRHWQSGNRTFFWTSTAKNEKSAYGFDFHAGYNEVFGGDLGYLKVNAISVRCIKK